MGVTTAESWSRALLDGGKAADTPAALIRRCSYSDQQTIHCRLDEVADRLTPASKFRPPVIVILGEVTELASTMSWLETRPLFGQTVLVTRPKETSGGTGPRRFVTWALMWSFNRQLPSNHPIPTTMWTRRSNESMSSTHLSFVAEMAFATSLIVSTKTDVMPAYSRALQIAVVGRQTAHKLSHYHIRADVVPSDFLGTSLATLLADDPARQNILLVRASRGNDDVAKILAEAGRDVTQVVAYSHRGRPNNRTRTWTASDARRQYQLGDGDKQRDGEKPCSHVR